MEWAQAHRLRCPADFYEPHSITLRSPINPEFAVFDRKGKPSGQLQFHESPHPIRVCAPGNGWGGTTAMACEVDAWCRHLNRWQTTPQGPVQVIWFAPTHKQFEVLRSQLVEMAFGRVPQYFASGKREGFLWPDGSQCFLGSYDSDWSAWQGIEPHLIAFDELPPPALWREMMMRRRGRRKARFICKATQTKGWSWMAVDLYKQWREHHIRLGVTDEEHMMVAQLHPTCWLWPRGGIHDNSAMSEADDRWYEDQSWPSRKERKVRLFGGFEQWSGDCIFEEEAMDHLRREREIELDRRGALKPPMLPRIGTLIPLMPEDPLAEPLVGEPERGWWTEPRQ